MVNSCGACTSCANGNEQYCLEGMAGDSDSETPAPVACSRGTILLVNTSSIIIV